MKVLMLSTFLDFGGIESKMVKVAEKEAENIEFVFVSLGKGGASEEKISSLGRRVVILNGAYSIPSISAIVRLCMLFKTENPDVVHCAGAEANFHGIIAAKVTGIKCIIAEEIGIPSQTAMAKSIFDLLYCQCRAIVAESEYVANFLTENYKRSASKVVVINNFIDASLTSDRQIFLNPEKQFLSICRLEPVKALDKVLQVFFELKKRGYKFKYHIVGSGSEEKNLKQLCRKYGLVDNVIFYGYRDDVEKFYRESDFFLMNSKSEGASNALLEAMSYGVPSISTKVGSAEALIEDGVNGWLVETGNKFSLYKGIEEAMNICFYEYKIKCEAAESSIKSGFTFKDYLDKIKILYSQD